jgi:hypothetical protein
MIQGLILGWVLLNWTVCLCKSEEGAWQIQCTNTGDEKSERAMESTWLQVPALAGHGRVADPVIAQLRACLKIFPWHTNISCWNLVCSTYPMLIMKLNFHSLQIWYVKFGGLQLIDGIWVHHFPFTRWLHTTLHRKSPIAAFRHAHQDLTIAHIIPKIAIRFVTTQVLLCKDRKRQWLTVGSLFARIGNSSMQ